MAELMAAYSPPIPEPVKNRVRKKNHGANANAVATVAVVDREGQDEQIAPTEAVGQVTEEQRTQACPGDVDCRRHPDVRRGERNAAAARGADARCRPS